MDSLYCRHFCSVHVGGKGEQEMMRHIGKSIEGLLAQSDRQLKKMTIKYQSSKNGRE